MRAFAAAHQWAGAGTGGTVRGTAKVTAKKPLAVQAMHAHAGRCMQLSAPSPKRAAAASKYALSFRRSSGVPCATTRAPSTPRPPLLPLPLPLPPLPLLLQRANVLRSALGGRTCMGRAWGALVHAHTRAHAQAHGRAARPPPRPHAGAGMCRRSAVTTGHGGLRTGSGAMVIAGCRGIAAESSLDGAFAIVCATVAILRADVAVVAVVATAAALAPPLSQPFVWIRPSTRTAAARGEVRMEVRTGRIHSVECRSSLDLMDPSLNSFSVFLPAAGHSCAQATAASRQGGFSKHLAGRLDSGVRPA
eukprot:355285-Chlamydomonas_euryale.AAC.8